MKVTITKPQPTVTIHLNNGKGNVELTAKEFTDLHYQMTRLYNDNYNLLEGDSDDE